VKKVSPKGHVSSGGSRRDGSSSSRSPQSEKERERQREKERERQREKERGSVNNRTRDRLRERSSKLAVHPDRQGVKGKASNRWSSSQQMLI
ncbi:hypothetical protein KIPB_014608, partial [Kipferlia bialata]